MKQTPRRVIGGGSSEPNPSEPDSPIEPTDTAAAAPDHDDEEDEPFDVDNRATPLGGSGDKGYLTFFIFL